MDLSDTRIAALEVTPLWSGYLDMDAVKTALADAGIPKELWPREPSRAVCMRRAFDSCAPRGSKIDMLPRGMGVAMSLKDVDALDLAELAKTAGHEVREAASYHTNLTAKILARQVNGTDIIDITFTPDDHPMIPLVQANYEIECTRFKASEDLSYWIAQIVVPACGGIGKRSRGGVYYIPAHRRDLILKVSDTLNNLSSSYELHRNVGGVKVPVHRLRIGGKLCIEPRYSDDSAAVEIMIDGVIREADAQLDLISGLLESPDKKLGARALKSKLLEVGELEREITHWESMTAVSLELLRDRLEVMKRAIGTAELAADAT